MCLRRSPNAWLRLSCAVLASVALACGSGADGGTDTASSDGAGSVVIGIVAKSQSNPVFQAAHAGATAAVKDLDDGRYGGALVELDIQTPSDEDPQRQAEAIEQLARRGAKGIAVACSDANTLTPAIDKAVELGAVVMCFDSDAPRSERLCYFGTDDIDCGRQVMRELAGVMGERGKIAILAGNQTAPNLQKRVEGVLAELAEYGDMALVDDGIIYHPETPEQAAEAVNRIQSTHPDIEGWAFVGGWPLFTRGALKWEPGAIKVVSVDALPPQLAYLESGHVQVLLAQDCFGWGQASVDILLRRIVDGEDPEGERIIAPLTRVTSENVADIERQWELWLSDG